MNTTVGIRSTMNVTKLACDYLIVGAGAASMAFMDTLLTEHPSTKIVLVDKNAGPSGHWQHAYGFVRLHQPSLLYGVASRQLEGSWLKLLLTRLTLPWQHRASKEELVRYYSTFIQDKVTAGQIQYFPNCQYNFDLENNGQQHSFASLDGTHEYQVHVGTKLINGILGECIIPSQSPVSFPVHKDVALVTHNQIYDFQNTNNKHFCVLGAGKTAMDTVVYLQRDKKVDPSNISWVVPQDVWMLLREGGGNPWSWPDALLEHNGDQRQASLALEQRGIFVRLDPNVEPTQFKFPVVGKDELKYMRRVRNLIRRGRVTSIDLLKDSNKVVVEFGQGQPAWIPNDDKDGDSRDIVFVHCTSPGPFNDHEEADLFASDRQLNLNLLFAPPVPISMSVLAYLESARLNGTLDLDFGRQLLQSLEGHTSEQAIAAVPENEVLRRLIVAMPLKPKDGVPSAHGDFQSILNLALVLALANPDPMVAYNWMSKNRLSFLSVPGFKCGVYEALGRMRENSAVLGYTKEESRMFGLLQEKLAVLQGR